MGRRIFCLSLIVLAIAMGLHHRRHGPKPVVKPRRPPPVVWQGSGSGSAATGSEDSASDEGSDDDRGSADAAGSASDQGSDDDGSGSAGSGSGSESGVASPAHAADTLASDPIELAWLSLSRNPFLQSPYELAARQAGQQTGSGEEVVEVKRRQVVTMPGEYTGSLDLASGLVAIIGRDSYRAGDLYNGKRITRIEPKIVVLDDPETTYIIAKRGVTVEIASSGEYTVDDGYWSTSKRGGP